MVTCLYCNGRFAPTAEGTIPYHSIGVSAPSQCAGADMPCGETDINHDANANQCKACGMMFVVTWSNTYTGKKVMHCAFCGGKLDPEFSNE